MAELTPAEAAAGLQYAKAMYMWRPTLETRDGLFEVVDMAVETLQEIAGGTAEESNREEETG